MFIYFVKPSKQTKNLKSKIIALVYKDNLSKTN